MTKTPAPTRRRSVRRANSHARHREQAHPGRQLGALARYADDRRVPREIVAWPSVGGGLLVIDREVATRCDQRLVARMEPDEPAPNAALVCRLYLQDRRKCRRVVAGDLLCDPTSPELDVVVEEPPLHDPHGHLYALDRHRGALSIPELRWVRRTSTGIGEPVSVREVIGALESYEPARALTQHALLAHRGDPSLSISTLQAELERVHASRIVLNRGLREAVLATIANQGLSMSEIAIRCGRIKRDARGRESGETSWLARRLGLLPEGGAQCPTPWVHSDVLALIARDGLGIAPREVELG
jgi:hypothetical protein